MNEHIAEEQVGTPTSIRLFNATDNTNYNESHKYNKKDWGGI